MGGLGCVSDSVPRQPQLVSGGSRTLVAMTTPSRNAGRPVQRVCLCSELLKGRAQAVGEGRGWQAERRPGSTGDCGNQWKAEGTCFREQVDEIMEGTGGEGGERNAPGRRTGVRHHSGNQKDTGG